ncbi:MAG: response regulator transcription factor [Actinomycetes bacterium]
MPGQDEYVASVLVVEDERDIRELLRRYLERAGHSVLTTGSGAEALNYLVESPPELLLLDLGLPDVDGLDVLAEAVRSECGPIIVLTARNAVEDRIKGLELGADDYIVKPFSPREVLLRIDNVLKRNNTPATATAESLGGGRLLIDQQRREASLDGETVDLTPTQWGLLTVLAGKPGRVFTRSELVNRVRGYEFEGYERSIDSHVKNLRQKLGTEGSAIVETVFGVGYRLGWTRDE